jgi:toxin ParE1/3/4
MLFTVVIEKRALKDAQKAINYYDEQLIGLGEKFNNALDKHIATIAKNPFYQIRYKDYRALPIKKFPYIIVFYVNENTNTVFISAVFNAKQNPKKLPK